MVPSKSESESSLSDSGGWAGSLVACALISENSLWSTIPGPKLDVGADDELCSPFGRWPGTEQQAHALSAFQGPKQPALALPAFQGPKQPAHALSAFQGPKQPAHALSAFQGPKQPTNALSAFQGPKQPAPLLVFSLTSTS
ncbi:MAG: hypothetical protein Q9174_001910 [Haloplaca sp. 1 TL-2023]